MPAVTSPSSASSSRPATTPAPRSPLARLQSSVLAAHQRASSRADRREQLREYNELLMALRECVDAVTNERDRVLTAVLRAKDAPSHMELAEELGVTRQRVDQLAKVTPTRRRRRARLLQSR